MDPETHHCLQNLHNELGPRAFGKRVQKLLAQSLSELGFTHVVEREVQGVDIDIAGPLGKFAIEVKTTVASSVCLSAENIEGLHKRVADGYYPVIAVLQLGVLDQWILSRVPPQELRAAQMPVSRLRRYRMRDLEEVLKPVFERVVKTHCHGA